MVSPEAAREIHTVAMGGTVDPNRVAELEVKTGHDVIAINTALEALLSPEARTHVNKAKTSADTTQPSRALQFKSALEVIARVTANLRDIMCEKALYWSDVPFMDVTHGYDALPTLAGRPLVHYVEMLQSNLEWIEHVYRNSIK